MLVQIIGRLFLVCKLQMEQSMVAESAGLD